MVIIDDGLCTAQYLAQRLDGSGSEFRTCCAPAEKTLHVRTDDGTVVEVRRCHHHLDFQIPGEVIEEVLHGG